MPRGRKGKKMKKDNSSQKAFEEDLAKMDFDPETVIVDEGYKRHLQRHSNK